MASLSLADRDKIRGMLADKQSAKTIAQEYEVDEADVLALAKPKVVRLAAGHWRIQPTACVASAAAADH